jgi:hypothetical protein
VDIADPAGAPNRSAYNALWLRITELVRRSGARMLLLTPLLPADLPEGRWLHLDCPDDVRRTRLASRGWSVARIDEAVADAVRIRKVVPRSVPGDLRPDETARLVLAWVGG